VFADVLILSNGPGEVATWVRPVVQGLRQRYPDQRSLRISLVLSPCPHGTGQELAIARRFSGIDRFQGAAHFFPFLLWGHTPEAWDWRDRGLVLFLGGDQFFALWCGKRLGYRILTYVEWEARWLPWVDRVAAMSPRVLEQVPSAHRHKVTIVGDLIADSARATVRESVISESNLQESIGLATSEESAKSQDTETSSDLEKREPAQSEEWVALLPGSKSTKLLLGLPFMLAIADYLHRQRPQTRFWIPVAPTLTPESLATYADSEQNPLIPVIQGSAAVLTSQGTLQTPNGLEVELDPTFPAYDRLVQSALALTTVGANTGELGALGVPMLVLLPTQHLAVVRAWDGIPGLLVRIPWLGGWIATGLAQQVLNRNPLLAWPNIWAGKAIVPEMVGKLTAAEVGDRVLEYLAHPEQGQAMRAALRQVRGQTGAASGIVEIIEALLSP
jgi:lipid A disaccharide synthetase